VSFIVCVVLCAVFRLIVVLFCVMCYLFVASYCKPLPPGKNPTAVNKYYILHITVAGLLMWGALSDERTGLSFTIAAGPRQCSYFRVRVTWNS
jgi:hypothetical protein